MNTINVIKRRGQCDAPNGIVLKIMNEKVQ